jgi:hypothetical protein
MLVVLAAASILLASLLVFIFDDGRPRFLSGSDGKVELERSDYVLARGRSEMIEMRQWRVWPSTFNDLKRDIELEFPRSQGWKYSERAPDWLQAQSPNGVITITVSKGDWRVTQIRRASTLDYYRAWIRSGGRLKPGEMFSTRGGASPKAGSPSKSP